MGRQRSQLAALKFQARGDGIGTPSHDTLLIRATVLSEARVNGFQISTLWERHEVVTSSIPDQIFDASFLPTGMHIGIDRHAWHSSPKLEGMALAKQEGFLPLGGEALHKHGS